MATKYSGRVSWRNGESESIALFSDKVPTEVLTEWADSVWTNMIDDIRWVDVLDMDTGEIIAEYNRWDYEPDDIDDECGFDPYMGCYTDDC